MEIINEYPMKVLYIDINELKEVAAQNLAFTVPTILILQGGREILRESRFIDFNKIIRLMELINN